jgi:hypothetical protein
MNRRPPDVWAVFLLHQAEGGCAGNFRYQAITLQNPFNECYGGLAHAFTADKRGCPALFAFCAKGLGF